MSAASKDGASHIEVEDLVVKYGDAVAVRGVSFAVRKGEHVTLLGPSGCGKTTTLRSIAGLEKPSSGAIRIGGHAMYDSAASVNVPAEQRDLSMVFQSYAVWPHMTVFDNVAYGLRVRKLPHAEIEAQVMKTLGLVQLQDFAKRSASKLSGGQQQRVAVARAIAFSPNVLLFDEPLSNLDAKLRAEMRVELRELQQRLGVTSLYVTHDQEEALAISDRVIVMNVGGIEQIGSPEDIYDRPRTRFVADFVGSANLVPGRVRAADGSGRVVVEAEGMTLHAMAPSLPKDGAATMAIRTAYIDMDEFAERGKENAVAGTIRRRMFHGDFIQYIVDWPAGQLIVRRPPTDIFEEGAAVTLSFAARHCVVLED